MTTADPPAGFWMWVVHIIRTPDGVYEVVGSHVEFVTASAGTTSTVPRAGICPVIGLEVRSVFSEKVRSPLGVTGHPQHSVNC